VRIVELELGEAEWERLIDGESQPWGGAAEDLRWAPKTHTIGLLDDGQLLGTGGVVLAQVRAGEARFPVAGVGGIFVTRRARGRGLARPLIERLLDIAAGLGPERALLFCLPERVGLYERYGFVTLEGPVRAMQPGGPLTMPMCTMWRALAPGIAWPPGEVELLGEPV
jgi:GNAT superfamily N-acetyltransferase